MFAYSRTTIPGSVYQVFVVDRCLILVMVDNERTVWLPYTYCMKMLGILNMGTAESTAVCKNVGRVLR